MSEQFEELPDDELDDDILDQVWAAVDEEEEVKEVLTLSPLEREKVRPG